MLSLNLRHFPLEFLLIFFCVANAANACAQAITIEGHVRTAQGEPIDDVRIDRLGKTDETGHFKIAGNFLRYWKTLWVDKKGFVPQVVSLNSAPSRARSRHFHLCLLNQPIVLLVRESFIRRVWKARRITVGSVNRIRLGA